MNIFEASILEYIFIPLHNDFLNKVMIFFSYLQNNGILSIIIAIICLLFKKSRKCGTRILIALLLGLIVGNLILKPLVGRIRPYDILNVVPLVPPLKDFSFPSGHTQASFAFASSVFITNRKFGIIAYIFAILVAISRMYLIVHYPTDIISGALLGILWAYISEQIINIIKKRTQSH